jgi:hypothetical protein
MMLSGPENITGGTLEQKQMPGFPHGGERWRY